MIGRLTHERPDAEDPRNGGSEVDSVREVVDRRGLRHIQMRETKPASPDKQVVRDHDTLEINGSFSQDIEERLHADEP